MLGGRQCSCQRKDVTDLSPGSMGCLFRASATNVAGSRAAAWNHCLGYFVWVGLRVGELYRVDLVRLGKERHG